MTDREWTREEVARQLGSLGVEAGGVLLVHSSFRAVRPVEDGPAGLIAAMREALGPEGTLVMPAWTDDGSVVFDPVRSRSDRSLGVVPATFWQQEGVLRSTHPFAFAAVGPRAAEILDDPLPLPPHRAESPVGRVRDLDGQVLLLGVDHDADTTIHLAELEAGAPYRLPKSITVDRDGRPERIEYGENDHCCARFRLAGDWLDAAELQRRGPVGSADAILVRSRDVVATVVSRLRDDPLLFLHPVEHGCEDCDAARASVDGSGR